MKLLTVFGGMLAVVAGALWTLSESSALFGLFVGRFHSVLVHFPIALVFLTAAIAWLRSQAGGKRFEAAESVLTLLAFASTAAAAITGYLLSLEGGFSEDILWWHLRLGILVTIGSLAALALFRLRVAGKGGWREQGYRICLGLTAAAVLLTGHLGGTLAHGSDYLTEYLPRALRQAFLNEAESARPVLVDPSSTTIFEGVVAPVIRDRCLECHSETRRRGGLSLAGVDAILRGGEGGPAVVPGNSQSSELLRRISLTPLDEDRMPPGDRAPLSIGEIELIRWWIDGGASSDRVIADAGEVSFPVQVHLDRISLPKDLAGQQEEWPEVTPPDAGLVRNLEASGFVAGYLAEGSPFLDVRLPAGLSMTSERADALEALAPQVAWLDLSGVSLEPGTGRTLGSLENLKRLNLSRSGIAGGDLVHLGGLSRLEYLNLYGTQVDDQALESLAALASLRSLYLWQTPTTSEGIAKLTGRLGNCTIVLGADSSPPESDGASRTQEPGD